MKIYVAGKFEQKQQVIQLQAKLASKGHTISYDWTTHKSIKPYIQNQAQAKIYADNEIQAIKESDIFIAFLDVKGTTLLLEIGAAIANHHNKGKPKVFLIGELATKSPWFFTEHVSIKETVDEVLTELN